MKKQYLLIAALVVAVLPNVLGPASADRVASDTVLNSCSLDPMPKAIYLDVGEILEEGLHYLVKGPQAEIAAVFPQRLWEEPFEGTSTWVALVIPTADTTWPPSGQSASMNPEMPESPNVQETYVAWRVVQDWRLPFLMFSPQGGPLDAVSLGVYEAGQLLALQALDHLNQFHNGQDRHAWVYLVREDGSERMLGQLEVADPAFMAIPIPERGEVQIWTHDSTVWWTQCPSLPSVAVTKTADPTQVPEPGDAVEFTVLVENPNPFALTLTSLVDDPYGDIADAGNPAIHSTTCAVPAPIPSGGSYECSFNASVSGNPGDRQIDTVTARAQDEWSRETWAEDDAEVEILDVPSSIKVTKTAEPSRVPEPGADVVFVVVVENTSPVDNVIIQTVVDDQFGDVGGHCEIPLPVTLAPEETLLCGFTRFVGGDPGDTHTNVVTAEGVDDDGNPVRDQDDALVTIENVPSAIRVIKKASPYWMYYPGGDVTFRLTINNLSAVDTVKILSLEDTIYGDLEERGDCTLPQTLAVEESYTCSFTTEVSGEPETTHTNMVTAEGIDDDGFAVRDDDTAIVTIAAVPTRVELLDLAVFSEGNLIAFEWETSWEQDNWGFNVYRGETLSLEAATWMHFEQAGGVGRFEGQSYRYEDREVVPGQIYYYWLEDVSVGGDATRYGPLMAVMPYRLYLPLLTGSQ